MNKSQSLIGMVWVLVLVFTACSSSSGDPLAGTTWTLIRLGQAQVLEGYIPSLEFQDGLASGSTGCNEFSAAYSVKGATISLEQIQVTERACMDQRAMGQETEFLRLFGNVRNFSLDDSGQMEMMNDEQEILLTFQQVP